MDNDVQLELLRKHKLKLASFSSYFEAWLETASDLVSETLGNMDARSVSFKKLQGALKLELIGKTGAAKEEVRHKYFLTASKQFEKIILQLEKEGEVRAAKEKLEAMEKERKTREMFSLPVSAFPPTPKPKKSGM